jgi:hypothetical protein
VWRTQSHSPLLVDQDPQAMRRGQSMPRHAPSITPRKRKVWVQPLPNIEQPTPTNDSQPRPASQPQPLERSWCLNPDTPKSTKHPMFCNATRRSRTQHRTRVPQSTPNIRPNSKATRTGCSRHTRFPYEQARVVRCVTGL